MTSTSAPPRLAGFIFAFYEYTGDDPTALENVVHTLTEAVTGSQLIHVDIVPVVHAIGEDILIDNEAYTALMGRPFKRHCASRCYSKEFTLLYLPLTHECTLRGVKFLRELEGKPYAMCKLPLAALPYSLRTCIGRSVSKQKVRSVFCSEAALLMCQACGMLQGESMAASACTPGNLFDILKASQASPVQKRHVHMFFSDFCLYYGLQRLLLDRERPGMYRTSFY